MAETSSTIVIGGGVVGLACAVELQRRGRSVTLIDQEAPGQACSFGNAGIIAASEVFPIISPQSVVDLPRMLLSFDGPAVIRASSLPKLAPWMTRAGATLTRKRQAQIVEGLSMLNRNAVSAWRDLLTFCGARCLLHERGMIRLVRRSRDWQALEVKRKKSNALALSSRPLSLGELRELEPSIGGQVIAGLLHESDAHVSDPYDVSMALLDNLRACGAIVLRETALSIEPLEGDVRVWTNLGSHTAAQALVTMGLRSGEILSIEIRRRKRLWMQKFQKE